MDNLFFYQMITVILSMITLISSIGAVSIYCLMKKQLNKLVKIHNLGQDFDIPTMQTMITEGDDGMNTGRTNASSASTSNMYPRDAIVKIIKF